MYTVAVAHECGCFKKSEYTKQKEFQTQRDAYNYAQVLSELMNEDFCTQHVFASQRVGENEFLISVSNNPDAGSCSTDTGDAGSCGTSCGC